jgi:hypothetical protein
MRRIRKTHFLLLALSFGGGAFAREASAVVTFGGTGNETDAAPGNVGMYEGLFNGGYSATPITSNMIVTAAHLFPGPTTTFVYNNGTATATTYNVQAVASLDDLAIWEISPNQPGTFTLTAPIYTGSSELGSTIVDVGQGYARGDPITGGWSWNGNNGGLSWGTNTVSAVPTSTQLGLSGSMGGDFLQYDFDNEDPSSPNYNPDEAVVTPGDSGGGAFIDVNGQYELAGVNSSYGVRVGANGLLESVTDSTGSNLITGSLYDSYGYYYNSLNGTVQQITTHTPDSSFATRVSSKQNFVGVTDGTASTASSPINDDGLFTAYTNMTTGAITGTGSIQIGGSGTTADLQIAPNSGTSEVTGLTINPNSTLDLTNNRLIIDGGTNPWTEKWLLSCLASGCDGGLWNGPGIDSSVAAANPEEEGVGFADANDAYVKGLTKGQVEIAYTREGDINMDGVVNGTDFAILATNYSKSTTLGWEAGDFNYDGKVNAADFLLLAYNLNDTTANPDWAAVASFAAANGIALNGTDVPEPSALGLLLIGSVAVFVRPRRQKPVYI